MVRAPTSDQCSVEQRASAACPPSAPRAGARLAFLARRRRQAKGPLRFALRVPGTPGRDIEQRRSARPRGIPLSHLPRYASRLPAPAHCLIACAEDGFGIFLVDHGVGLPRCQPAAPPPALCLASKALPQASLLQARHSHARPLHARLARASKALAARRALASKLLAALASKTWCLGMYIVGGDRYREGGVEEEGL